MYKRSLTSELEEAAKGYPVVTLMGPRQSGKTTLVRQTFPNKPYVNLEALDMQEMALADPRRFLANYPEGAILDEIQRAPALLSYIQVIVDAQDQKGMFILTGSHQMDLHEQVAQSLAGRTALLYLLPLSLQELRDADIPLSLDETLLKGGYPRIFKDHLDPIKAYRNYFQTYVEKDLRKLIQVKDLSQFQKFVRLCAGRIGGLLHLEALSNEVGVSAHTIKAWLSILEASFIIILLRPYHENFGKRAIKSPKLYFTDVGLASYLLGIETLVQMSRDPLRGFLLENLVVLELTKWRFNQGLDPQLYYFRDTQGHEVDLILQLGHELIPFEVKASQTFHLDFLRNLQFFKTLVGNRCPHGYLVYDGEQQQRIADFTVVNYKNLTQTIKLDRL
jgi:predicted AAA+ superfamily ATPase